MPRALIFFLGCVFFISFIIFSYIVSKEKFNRIDYDTTIRVQENLPRKVDPIFSLFSVAGSIQVTAIIWFILFIFLLTKRYWLAAMSLVLLPLGLYMEIYGKQKIFHPAPPYNLYRGVFNLDTPCYPIGPNSPYFCYLVHSNYSYPSGHILRTTYLTLFITIYILFHYRKRIHTFIIPLTATYLFIMILSRVYLGEHWTSDVIGGFLLGGSLGLTSALTIPIKNNFKF